MVEKSIDLFCFGECMLEYSPAFESMGGDTFNTAAHASLLGCRVSYLTKIGNDHRGELLLKLMKSYPINFSNVHIVKGKTGAYWIDLNPEGERSFRYDRLGSAASTLTYNDIPIEDLRHSKIIFTSGVTQVLSKNCNEMVKKVFENKEEWNAQMAFDINFRSNLSTVEETSDNLKNILPYIDILLLSDEDLIILKNALDLIDNKSFREICKDERIPPVVIFRKGAKGIECFSKKNGIIEMPALEVEKVVDTTGAGDSFNGGFFYSIIENKALKSSLAFGIEQATKQVQFFGALPTS